MRILQYLGIVLAAIVAVACGDTKNEAPRFAPEYAAEQQARKPFYVANPESGAPDFTVESPKCRLAFAGWGVDDPSFTLQFPDDEPMRRVVMRYTMTSEGSGPASYDNTVMLYVRSKSDGEWYEIARAFTPFGDEFDASWQKHFYIDVTEYASLLRGATEFRYHYAGFDATSERAHAFSVAFSGYYGEAEHDVVGIAKLYDSSLNPNVGSRGWAYGVAGHDIEAHERLGSRTVSIPSGVSEVVLRLTITGHGHDKGTFPGVEGYEPENVAEFVENSYAISVDGKRQAAMGRIFYSNANNYYQAGTYYYDRANWAPGNPANVHYWTIRRVTTDAGSMTIDIDLPEYVSEFSSPDANDGVANYIVTATLFFI